MFILVSFVAGPLILYVVLFAIEAVWSVRRMFTRSDAAYFQTTWEITHTLFIFAVNSFLWLYSSAVPKIAHAVAATLLVAVVLYILRTVAYITVFYRSSKTRRADLAFAITNWGALVAIITVALEATFALSGKLPEPNPQLIPYLWPGLVLVLGCCAVPLAQMYRSHLVKQ